MISYSLFLTAIGLSEQCDELQFVENELVYLYSTAHYVQIHTEDSRRIGRNMYAKLKNVVFFI